MNPTSFILWLLLTIYWFFQSRPLDSIKTVELFLLSPTTLKNQFYFRYPISPSLSTCLFPEKKKKKKKPSESTNKESEFSNSFPKSSILSVQLLRGTNG